MTSPFLPPLSDEKLRIKSGEAGKWQPQEGIAYSEVADSLARPDAGTDTKSISSIPDMWARPLFVDMVLRDQDHPLHGFIKAQWKGMLAAIALAEVKRLKLQAQLLDLEDLKSDTFIQALRELIPSSDKTVYQLTERIKGANRNPWEKIYVFVLNGQPVGMTSPATLVCPSEQGKWEGVTWWIDGQLHSPLDSSKYLTDDDKIQLWLWLENLRQQLNRETGNSTKLKEILGEYQSELKGELKIDPNSNSQSLRLSKSTQYFGVSLTLGNLDALNVPIQARKQESSVKLLSLGKIKTEAEEVLFIPKMELLLDQWKTKEAKDIWVYDTSSAAIFDLAEFKKQYKGKGKFLTEDDIFAEDFYYLEGKGNLPGALLPDDVDEITYTVDEQERSLTPLLPLKSEILGFFSPEELIKRLKFSPTTIGNKSGVTVELNLRLSGGDFTIRRNYSIESTNAITAIPFLEIWPNFKAPNWKAYYAFYFDDRIDDVAIFRAVFPDATEIHPVDLKNFQLTRLESFPDYILCQDEKGCPQGLILLKTPPVVGDQNPNKTWTVGVDFGTSFTNIYYYSQNNNFRDALTLTPLHLQITQKPSGRQTLMLEYFMSAKSQSFPLSSVLTIKGTKEQERPIFDGRLFIPKDVREFDPNQDDIKTDLKWKLENIPYNRTFLKHLALLISVEAANNHVRKINWSISYPSAFSRNDKNLYKVTWQRIIEDLNKTTGIEHQWLSKGNPYRAESLALAHYFADEENKDLVYTTCIDMGGGSSDISIWVGNRLIHQCSVLVAGRLLFSQFWKKRPEFLNQQFEVDLTDLTNSLKDDDDAFFVKLDGLLSAEGNEWLETYRTTMDDHPNLQSIVQLSTIGISGLYYYIGLILRALDIEGKYTRQQNTPVYIGGNGSRILNWLDFTGQFTPDSEASLVFSRMLSKASGFDDTREKTVLSRKPKAEVACGLVLDQESTRLTGLQDDDEDVFAGEDCEINKVVFDWNHRLNLSQFRQIDSFTLPSSDDDSGLTNLKCFLDDFCKSFKDLRIISIKPLRKYEEEQWRNDLWKSVKRRVEANLSKFEKRNSEDVRVEPLFILGLKALLTELNDRL